MEGGGVLDILFGILIFLVIIFLIFYPKFNLGQDFENISYVDISSEEAKIFIENNPGVIIIDISPYYEEGHILGAINYYLGDGSLDNAIPSLDKNAIYLIYCHADSVSRSGAQKLIDSGFTNVYRLEGNYAAWVNAGYEIEK